MWCVVMVVGWGARVRGLAGVVESAERAAWLGFAVRRSGVEILPLWGLDLGANFGLF